MDEGVITAIGSAGSNMQSAPGRQWHHARTQKPVSVRCTPCHNPDRARRCVHRSGVCATARTRRARLPAHATWLRSGAVDCPPSPFAELHLLDRGLANVGGPVHKRNYSGLTSHTGPEAVPDLAALFHDPSLPLLVDVGCGAGRFVLLAALHGAVPGAPSTRTSNPPLSTFSGQPCNVLGLDQHAALIARGGVWAEALGLAGRCAYVAVNVRSPGVLATLAASYPGPLALLAVQYPDPHYRRDRHVVTAEFVEWAAGAVAPGGMCLLTSDVLSTARHMRDAFATFAGDVAPSPAFGLHALHSMPGAIFDLPHDVDINPYLSPDMPRRFCADGVVPLDAALSDAWVHSGWLATNPMGIPTEREVYAELVTGSPVFRILLQRV